MRYLFFFTAYASLVVTHAQSLKLHYNEDWRITKSEQANFFRICQYDLNSMTLEDTVRDYWINGTMQMQGVYQSNKKHGLFTFYYSNGKKQMEGIYADDKRVGDWSFFYSNGQLSTTIRFTNPDKPMEFELVSLQDEEGVNEIEDGIGILMIDTIERSMFYPNEQHTLIGRFKEGMKHGDWVLTKNDGQLMVHAEEFKNGQFRMAKIYTPFDGTYGTIGTETMPKIPEYFAGKFHYTEKFALDESVFPAELINADVIDIFEAVTGQKIEIQNRPAGYPDGDFALMAYIGDHFSIPKIALKKKLSGTVYVSVEIDEEGKPAAIEVLRGVHEDVDLEAIRVVSSIEQWLPAIVEGQAISSKITVPVKLNLIY